MSFGQLGIIFYYLIHVTCNLRDGKAGRARGSKGGVGCYRARARDKEVGKVLG